MTQKQIGSGLQVVGAAALIVAAFVFGGFGWAMLALGLVCIVFGTVIEHEAAAPPIEEPPVVEREKPGEV